MAVKKPKKFQAYELVDKATYECLGEKSLQSFRPELIEILDQLSEGFPGKAITVNNWKAGGPFQWRGLRTRDCTQGAVNGAHFVGAGVDFNVAGMTSDAVFQYIKANPGKFPAIRRLEDPKIATSWTHADCFEHDGSGILVVGA
jgi:hypothetical protein